MPKTLFNKKRRNLFFEVMLKTLPHKIRRGYFIKRFSLNLLVNIRRFEAKILPLGRTATMRAAAEKSQYEL